MKQVDFIEQVRKIENCFNKKLTPEQLKLWREKLKEIDIDKFKQIVEDIIKTNKFMPTIADILNKTNNNSAYGKSTFKQIWEIDENYFYANLKHTVSSENMIKINNILGKVG